MKYTFLLIGLILITNLFSQTDAPKLTEVWEPVPKVILPGTANSAPSDAIILFDGTTTSAWQHADKSAVKWELKDGVLTVKGGTGAIMTKEAFGDVQLHIEWRAPLEVVGNGQGRGNSGVFLQNRYEVQVLDSYNNETYPNGQAASIYKQHIPLVNAMRPTGEWQIYDIIFMAPKFSEDGYVKTPGHLTLLHNGILVQNHVELRGTTEYIGIPKNIAHGNDVIQLQDHGNPVSFRNIWLRKL